MNPIKTTSISTALKELQTPNLEQNAEVTQLSTPAGPGDPFLCNLLKHWFYALQHDIIFFLKDSPMLVQRYIFARACPRSQHRYTFSLTML